MQRPETEVRILPSTWHENGVGIFGSFGESFEYRSYVISGFNAQNFSDAGIRSGRQQGNRSLSEDFAWVTRADWTPEALPGFLLGGSFYLGDSGQDVELDGLSPLIFSSGPYERHSSRWFGVFRYRWTPELSGWEVLYGAIMYRRDRDRDENVFSILGGLFECGVRERSLVFRLLYVPWW